MRQAGSLKALFPRGARPDLQAVLVNTAGGITGGDRFEISARAGAGSRLTLTTQAAERAYRALPGDTGKLTSRLFVGGGARLSWLPQETILYRGCALRRRLSAELAEDASLLLIEPLIFGRAAMGETLDQARFHDRIEICRRGEMLFLDAMTFDGDVAAQLARPAIAGGAGALATLVLVDARAEAHLAPLRDMLPDTGGVSLIGEDVLVMRLLAADGFLLRQSLLPILDHLTGDALPRPWRL